jgi:hypothetical protein
MRRINSEDSKNGFTNMQEIINKIQDIPHNNLYFINCSKIEKTKNGNNCIITIETKENVYIDFDDFFNLLCFQKKNLVGTILYSYKYLLHTLDLLKVHNLEKDINISSKDIVFNKYNNTPLLKISFNEKTDNKMLNQNNEYNLNEYNLNNIYLKLLKMLDLNQDFKSFFSLFLNLNKEKEAKELHYLLENMLNSNPFSFFLTF